jgi:HD-GYP domain-containing protein (c-di-GMP phosphodiesterase class II)
VERTRLLEGQQKQIDSMISLLAGAIDAKSPHTGRHCSRVPELALMLAEAAEACESGLAARLRQDQHAGSGGGQGHQA